MSNNAVVPETPRIETEIQVMFFDTDCAAVVHNIAYLRFIEIARTLLAEQLGMVARAFACPVSPPPSWMTSTPGARAPPEPSARKPV